MEHSEQVKAQIYEKVGDGKSTVRTEENDDWKYVEITPPPKTPIGKDGLVLIKHLPPFA